MTDVASAKISTSAVDRMRLYRRRRQEGVVFLSLLLDSETVDDLVSLAWLEPERRADKRAVLSAFIRFASRAFE